MLKAKRLTALLFSVLFVLLATACKSGTEQDNGGLSIVATLFPQYDFARQILGDKGEVSFLLQPGTESHDYELTNSDMLKINKADIFLYTGDNMETWVSSIKYSIDCEKVTIVDLSAGIELKAHHTDGEEHSHEHGHDHGEYDAHIWTSPLNALQMLERIYNVIVALDEKNQAYYKENYDSYRAELEAIDAELREISASAKRKTLYFTGKFAFLYLTEEYGFNYVAPFNSCGEQESESISAVADLISQIKNDEVPFVFYEELSSANLKDTVINETGAEALLLHSVHNLSKDDFEAGKTYVDIMRQNAANLRKAVS